MITKCITYLLKYVSKLRQCSFHPRLPADSFFCVTPTNNRHSDWMSSAKCFLIGQRGPKHYPHHRVTDSMAAPMSGVVNSRVKSSSFNATSFQKKTRSKLLSIHGTRPSVQNGQLLVSTGVTSLDFLLGQCGMLALAHWLTQLCQFDSTVLSTVRRETGNTDWSKIISTVMFCYA